MNAKAFTVADYRLLKSTTRLPKQVCARPASQLVHILIGRQQQIIRRGLEPRGIRSDGMFVHSSSFEAVKARPRETTRARFAISGAFTPRTRKRAREQTP